MRICPRASAHAHSSCPHVGGTKRLFGNCCRHDPVSDGCSGALLACGRPRCTFAPSKCTGMPADEAAQNDMGRKRAPDTPMPSICSGSGAGDGAGAHAVAGGGNAGADRGPGPDPRRGRHGDRPPAALPGLHDGVGSSASSTPCMRLQSCVRLITHILQYNTSSTLDLLPLIKPGHVIA